ncbi:hypothetical protein VCV18_005058 [Metarhizium anisopliae]
MGLRQLLPHFEPLDYAIGTSLISTGILMLVCFSIYLILDNSTTMNGSVASEDEKTADAEAPGECSLDPRKWDTRGQQVCCLVFSIAFSAAVLLGICAAVAKLKKLSV